MYKLIYFGDPMCSWCYGFAPELNRLLEAFPTVDFELVPGGLRPYGQEQITSMKSFLLKHWTKINEMTGQVFSYEILDDPDFRYDTEPGSRAIVVAHEMNSNLDLAYYEAVQSAFYAESVDIRQIDNLTPIAEKFGLDTIEYKRLFESEEMKDKTRECFAFTMENGINAFPTLVLETTQKKYLLARGYQKADTLIEKVNEIISSPS